MMHNVWKDIEEMPLCFSRSSVTFQGHMRKEKNANIDPILVFLDY